MSRVPLVVFSDFTCPYSYVTEALLWGAAGAGAEIRAGAFELYPAPGPLPAGAAPPGEQTALRLLADAAGVRLQPPAGPPPRTRKAHEAARFARAHDAEPALRAAIFAAFWAQARDVGRIDVLVELGAACGLDATALRIALDIDRYEADVLRDQADAHRAGIRSVPTLIVGAGEKLQLLVGAQTADAIAEAIRATTG